MTTAIFAVTQKGLALAERLRRLFPDALIERYSKERVVELFPTADRLIFVMATGIVVRALAPLLRDKKTDPGVVVIDEKGRYVISLVSGHLGGGNALAHEVAYFLKAEPVITTASDLQGLPSIDLWAQEHNLAIENWEMLPTAAAKLVNTGVIAVYSETPVELPPAFFKVPDPDAADVIITKQRKVKQCACSGKDTLMLRPRNLVVGVGFNNGTSAEEIEQAVRQTLKEHNLSFLSIQTVATIEKKASEQGLVTFATSRGLTIRSYTAAELNTVHNIEPSPAAIKATGANAVAEPAALLASGMKRLLVHKQRIGNVTVAVALMSVKAALQRKGRITIVGSGPGSMDQITPRALKALRAAEVIVGYDTYLDLIKPVISGKEIVSTGMTQEIDRAKAAIERARTGSRVAVVSGGDPGIYAMAGLVFELLHRARISVAVEVVPGISALNAGAALLGAPLMHDFCAISLSDRLTPWDAIARRLEAAASADFVIVLYNPRSHGRPHLISEAIGIISRHRSTSTPVGIVRAASRDAERVLVTTINAIPFDEIDMQTTVFIGNSRTFLANGRMVTPRGYEKKYE